MTTKRVTEDGGAGKVRPTPGPYYLEGLTVYALQESGDYHVPMVNRWSALVQAVPGTPAEEMKAVAVLFRAEPDLLAALEALVAERHQCFIPTDTPGALYDWDERAATAIAKARGHG